MTNEPVLNQVNLVVRDMAATLAFYRRLGLQIRAHPGWGAHHVAVEMPGGFTLELDSVEMARSYDAGWEGQAGGSSVILGFSLPTRDAVDARYAEMTGAGHPGRQEPYDAFWGARYAIVEDPDGNHVGLMSPIDPAQRGATPAL